jgi:hypothetical protein
MKLLHVRGERQQVPDVAAVAAAGSQPHAGGAEPAQIATEIVITEFSHDVGTIQLSRQQS